MSDEEQQAAPNPRPWEVLGELLASPDQNKVIDYLDSLPWSERARAISRLSAEDQEKLLTTLEPSDAADLVEGLPEVQAVELIERLDPVDAAPIVDELPSDSQADLLGELADQDAEAILAEMDPEEARGARALREYPSDTAGGLMITEYLAFPKRFTVAQVLSDLQKRADEYRDYQIQYFYAVEGGRPVGVINTRQLLLAPGTKAVAEIMSEEIVTVPALEPIEALQSKFDEFGFFALPVVDEDGLLIGVVTREALEYARAERSESDFLASQGIVGGDEIRTQPFSLRVRKRLSWLTINIPLNLLAASVIAFHEETLSMVIALAVFMPILSDMSGSAGNQAVAVSIRELSMGLVRPNELLRVLGKELSIGLVNGLILGILLAGVAFLWKGNPWLGLVVGGALAVNTIVAVIVGGGLPLIIKRLGYDPALASGVLLTTVTDMCGFFLALTFAAQFLPYLQGL